MDLSITDIDEDVSQRLEEKATSAGVSLEQYVRNELTRIASRLSPTEFVRGQPPMSRSEFESIRQRLRDRAF